MKYVIVLGDGMADYPVEELNNQTPLQWADLPVADHLAERGLVGLVKTVPDGMSPGSDTANLSVLGYNPRTFYKGRSPFEASSMGIEMKDEDISFRCNFVTLSGEGLPYEEKHMLDYSAGEISSEESEELIEAINKRIGTDQIKFYSGVSYRQLMIWEKGPKEWRLTPPHDIMDKKIGAYLPAGEGGEVLVSLMKESYPILENLNVNLERVRRGLNPANSLWFWGEGTKPNLPLFYDKYGVGGAVISATDLIKGIARYAGMRTIEVAGATGTFDTDYEGKARAALRALEEGDDLVFIHIEAPDECSHQGRVKEKIKSIEMIDQQVLGVIKKSLDLGGTEYSLLFLPDHATPLSLRTHTSDPVPFLIYRSGDPQLKRPGQRFTEKDASRSTILIEEGERLMDMFLNGTL